MRAIYLLLFLLSSLQVYGEDLTGFWITTDRDTKKPTGIVAVYPYQGKYYGRIIGSYNSQGVIDDTIYKPKDRAPGISGNPYYSGLDFVWNAKPTSQGKYEGYVVDPRKGQVYNAELWKEKNHLVLRGKVLIFGRNEYWKPFPDSGFTEDFKKPDLAKFVPQIPQVKK